MTTGIIVQARLTSSRLPRKVLMKLGGKPVLQYVLERARATEGADLVICAYPEGQEEIGELARKLGCETFVGPEHDVLERYWLTATHFNLDIIVRVTGDCPLLHPVVSHDVIRLRERNGVDYASNCYPERTFPKGFDTECFTWGALDYAHSFASDDYDREHVTSILQRDDEITKALLRQGVDESGINYCIDEPNDIERLDKIIRAWKQASLTEMEIVTRH